MCIHHPGPLDLTQTSNSFDHRKEGRQNHGLGPRSGESWRIWTPGKQKMHGVSFWFAARHWILGRLADLHKDDSTASCTVAPRQPFSSRRHLRLLPPYRYMSSPLPPEALPPRPMRAEVIARRDKELRENGRRGGVVLWVPGLICLDRTGLAVST